MSNVTEIEVFDLRDTLRSDFRLPDSLRKPDEERVKRNREANRADLDAGKIGVKSDSQGVTFHYRGRKRRVENGMVSRGDTSDPYIQDLARRFAAEVDAV